jgi:hypothetical protein
VRVEITSLLSPIPWTPLDYRRDKNWNRLTARVGCVRKQSAHHIIRPQRALAVNKVGHLAVRDAARREKKRPLFQSCARVHILMPQSVQCADAAPLLYVIVNEVNLIELHVAPA